MKGLQEYIDRYGYHFTESLVQDALPIRLKYQEIMKIADKMVWYNVTQATSGDILYLVNKDCHDCILSKRQGKRSVLKMVEVVGNYSEKDKWFKEWLTGSSMGDLSPYIN